MSKFMIGDRVQIIGDPTDYDLGTVIECKSSFGEDYCDVAWDVSGTYGQHKDSIFLVFRDGIFYSATAQTPSQANIELLAESDDMAATKPELLADWEKGLLEPPTFAQQVDTILGELGALLKAKNEAYGDSALNPVRIFSKADPADGLRVRIDDKLSRIARGSDAGEDTVTDLLGYLVMLKISEGNK